MERKTKADRVVFTFSPHNVTNAGGCSNSSSAQSLLALRFARNNCFITPMQDESPKATINPQGTIEEVRFVPCVASHRDQLLHLIPNRHTLSASRYCSSSMSLSLWRVKEGWSSSSV